MVPADLLVALTGQLGGTAVHEFNKRALGVTKPEKRSSAQQGVALQDAADRRVKDIAPDAGPLSTVIELVDPTTANTTTDLASNTRYENPNTGESYNKIRINPNADAAYFAHELGHSISQQTKPGLAVTKAREFLGRNPALNSSLKSAAAIAGLAGLSSALQEGNDDALASVLLASGLAAPTLIDEALATKNALAIMNDAGHRASLGQRGKLAGGYLSYVAPVLMAAGIGSAAGNMIDPYTAVYNLGDDGVPNK